MVISGVSSKVLQLDQTTCHPKLIEIKSVPNLHPDCRRPIVRKNISIRNVRGLLDTFIVRPMEGFGATKTPSVVGKIIPNSDQVYWSKNLLFSVLISDPPLDHQPHVFADSFARIIVNCRMRGIA